MLWTRLGALLLLIVAASCEQLPKSGEEREAEEFVANIRSSYQEIFLEMGKISWGEDNVNAEQANDIIQSFLVLLKSTNIRAKKFQYDNFIEHDLKRQIKSLLNIKHLALDIFSYLEVISSSNELKSIVKNVEICEYTFDNWCSFKYYPDVWEKILRSTDAHELQHYWLQWRDGADKEALPLLKKLVEHYATAAQLNDFRNRSAMYYYDYDNQDFFGELKLVLDEILPFYKELHAYTRHLLQDKYGEASLSSKGSIPEHFLEQLVAQVWQNTEKIDLPFPYEQLPNITEELNAQTFSTKRLVEQAAEYYIDFGFEELPRIFWTNDRLVEANSNGKCKSEVVSPMREIGGYKFCPAIDFRNFLKIHEDLATIYYDQLAFDLPVTFSGEACPGFGRAIGGAIALSVSTPSYLTEIGLARNFHNDEPTHVNRLYEMAVHSLFSLTKYFAEEKFWTELLNGDEGVDNSNCRYWKLLNEYAGVQPPIDREDYQFDVSPEFYGKLDLGKGFTEDIIYEVLKYQIYRGLCIKAGQYSPVDSTRPLHLCDLHKNKDVGHILKIAMSLGSSKNWHEILRILTGETEISGAAMIEYFKPLKVWIERENIEHHHHVGWLLSHRCGED